MKANLISLVLIVCVPSAYLNDNEKEDPYSKDVYVDFPNDVCDTSQLKMPDFTAPGRRISEVKCLEYIWRIKYFEGESARNEYCYMERNNVIGLLGGTSAFHGEYPHMGAIGWKAKVGTWIFKCGSSLISEKFVLTAAHCSSVTKNDLTVADIEPKIVRLGSKSILDTVHGIPAYDVEIRRFIKHHRYKPLRQYYDIALVELIEEISFNYKVHPACLWSKFENPELGMLTGWGVIELGTVKTSPVLQKAQIKIVNSTDCDKRLIMRRNRKWQGIVKHQLCAGDKAGRIDTCQGDSGGPLQTKIPIRMASYLVFPCNVYNIVGVTSFGFGCARKNTPSIYTRVTSFIGWIEDIVWPNTTTLRSAKEDRLIFKT